MALVHYDARKHDTEPVVLLPRRHRIVEAHAHAEARDTVLDADEVGAVLLERTPDPESAVHIVFYRDVADEPDPDAEDEPLPFSPPPPALLREELAIAWMDDRDLLAQRCAMLRGWVAGQEIPSLTGRRIEKVVTSLESVLRAMDKLTFDAAASTEATLLGKSDTLDALTREVHALVELVLAELEELALDHEAAYDRCDDDDAYDPSWRAAGRSFAEHVSTHVLAHVEPHVLALETRCRRGGARDMLMLGRVASGAAWVRRAVAQLRRELRPARA